MVLLEPLGKEMLAVVIILLEQIMALAAVVEQVQ
jgi:hypothetical protein